MVSLWPFRADSNSAESFEKALSTLSTKISKAATQNDRVRQRARRLKVGWTLYGGFTYILALLIFFLVTGWRNWGPMEYTVVSGGPLLLYTVRYLLNIWYNYWMSNSQDYLEALYKERDDTLEKLKTATKYDSTQKILEKYGGSRNASPNSTQKQPKANGKTKGQNRKSTSSSTTTSPQHQQRVFMSPPPTANIRREPLPGPPPSPPVTAEFAPNAFDESNQPPPQPPPSFAQRLEQPPFQQQYGQQPVSVTSGGGWMDRLVTALMGEDETLPTNRLAMLCTHCRLVNGLAPPGIRTLEELGKWKCSQCGAWNGVEAEPVPIPGVGETNSEKKPAKPVEEVVERASVEDEEEKDVEEEES